MNIEAMRVLVTELRSTARWLRRGWAWYWHQVTRPLTDEDRDELRRW